MIRKLEQKDKENWAKLYYGYADFYKVPMNAEILDTLWSWIHDENFWLRRTAIIYQLGYGVKTDESVLYKHILLTYHEKEFFIRKAIGWALRSYSKINQDSVRNFIETNQDKLSNLSIKEGSKYL